MQTNKIMVLGPSDSGKTVFLASMSKRLSIQRKEIGFFLDAAQLQQVKLTEAYNQIINPMDEWPAANQYREIKAYCADSFCPFNHLSSVHLFTLPFLSEKQFVLCLSRKCGVAAVHLALPACYTHFVRFDANRCSEQFREIVLMNHKCIIMQVLSSLRPTLKKMVVRRNSQ
jgi:hypothetical protein